MKSTIKIFVAFAMVLGFAVGAKAQTKSDKINAKAEIVAQVTVNHVQDLLFGLVTPNNTKTILTDGTLNAGTAGTASIGAEQVGKFDVTKGANTSVKLEFVFPTNNVLVNTTGTGNETLSINFTDAGTHKLAKLSKKTGTQTDFDFTPGSGVTTANDGSTAQYYSGTDFSVILGGTVVPDPDQVAGVYTGEITLKATYN